MVCGGGEAAGTVAVRDAVVRDGVEVGAVGAAEFANEFAGVGLGVIVQKHLAVLVDETETQGHTEA